MDKVKILDYREKYQIIQKMDYFTNFKMFVLFCFGLSL